MSLVPISYISGIIMNMVFNEYSLIGFVIKSGIMILIYIIGMIIFNIRRGAMALIIENASVDNDLPKSRQSANVLVIKKQHWNITTKGSV